MLSVSPPAEPGWLATLGQERASKRLRRHELREDQPRRPGSYGGDEDVEDDDAAAISSSEHNSTPSSSSLASSITIASRQSPSSLSARGLRSQSVSSDEAGPSAPCLLIRSMRQGWERTFELHNDWPLPRIEKPDEVLIAHRAIGLNPVDYKSVLYNFGVPDSPWVLGRDIAGVVAAVGESVTDLKIGQRVWTCADARDIRAGAYQSYSVSRRAHLGVLESDSVSDCEAATLGTGLVTASIAAYWFFRWPRAQEVGSKGKQPMPTQDNCEAAASGEREDSQAPWLLIYGGGAITGIYMAQLARLSGLRTIAIASPSNFAYLQSSAIGVDACVDRYLPPETIAQQVHDITLAKGGSGVRYILDCVGSKTATQCQSIAEKTAKARLASSSAPRHKPVVDIICLAGNPKKAPADSNDEPLETVVDVVIHRISFSTTIYGDDVFARAVMSDLSRLLDAGHLTPARAEILPDGLAGVRRGLEALRDNLAPRAKKLVVNVSDTPHAHQTNLGVRAETCWNGVA